MGHYDDCREADEAIELEKKAVRLRKRAESLGDAEWARVYEALTALYRKRETITGTKAEVDRYHDHCETLRRLFAL
jgi:hypothetical protein